jgi:pimeloyl-ACP methyl ester carboxylesterase
MFMGEWFFENLLKEPERWSFRLHTFDFPHHGKNYRTMSGLLVRFMSLRRYVEALIAEVERFDRTPVLIGHSIGAYAIQAALGRLRTPPRAVILICPTRQDVFANSTLDFAKRHPFWFVYLLFSFAMTAPIATLALTRELLFPKDMSDEEVRRYRKMMRGDSYWCAVECLFGWGPKPSPVRGIPVLVIGAEQDNAVRKEDVVRIAQFYGAELKWFDLPHNVLLAPGWEEVADYISEWIAALPSSPSGSTAGKSGAPTSPSDPA